MRVSTRGDAFAMVVGKKSHTERKAAGGSLLSKLRLTEKALEEGTWTMGQIGGFDLRAQGKCYGKGHYRMDLWLERTGTEQEVELSDELTALGLISRLEYMLDRFEADLAEQRCRLAEAELRLPGYRQRVGEVFGFQTEMEAKEAELAALEADLAANDNRDTDQPDAHTAT